MAKRGHTGESGIDGGGHGAELPLAVEELAEGIAEVEGLDLLRGHPGVGQGVADDVGNQVSDIEARSGVVAGEVGLGATEHEERHTLTFFFLGSGTNALVVSM